MTCRTARSERSHIYARLATELLTKLPETLGSADDEHAKRVAVALNDAGYETGVLYLIACREKLHCDFSEREHWDRIVTSARRVLALHAARDHGEGDYGNPSTV